jgi:hypothetical protein
MERLKQRENRRKAKIEEQIDDMDLDDLLKEQEEDERAVELEMERQE